jgi:hypothetical protein
MPEFLPIFTSPEIMALEAIKADLSIVGVMLR